MSNKLNTCSKCKARIDDSETYEYRGFLSCDNCFDAVIEMTDYKRQELINEEDAKQSPMKGLDFSDSIIGRENKKIFKRQREVGAKESLKRKLFEHR